MASVVFHGSFAGGSFGRPGNPNRSYDYYRVDCEAYREAVAAAHPAIAGAEWVFASEAAAKAALPAWQADDNRRRAERDRAEEKWLRWLNLNPQWYQRYASIDEARAAVAQMP